MNGLKMNLILSLQKADDLLQFKPKNYQMMKRLYKLSKQELFDKEVSLELKSAGLEQFASIVKVEIQTN